MAAAERRPTECLICPGKHGLDTREAALGRLLLEGVPEGGGVTRVVRNLHELALRDPRAFTCTIARAFPGFAELRGNGPRDESPLRATAGAGTFASLVSAPRRGHDRTPRRLRS